MKLLDEYQKKRIEFVASYIKGNTNDWLLVKRHLLNAMKFESRRDFSTRHRYTKKHTINEFEKEVMEFWYELTGTKLVLDPKMTHDPNWVHDRPRGWTLIKYHADKRRKREQLLENSN